MGDFSTYSWVWLQSGGGVYLQLGVAVECRRSLHADGGGVSDNCYLLAGVLMMLCSFSPLACLYHLVWSMSYILFPEALWSFKV